MDMINYFQIKSLIEIIIGEKIKDLFKKFYSIETNSEWKDNEECGNFIIENYLDYDNLDNHKDTIKSGLFDNYTFKTIVKLILEFKFHKLINNQKELDIIKTIKEIHYNNILENKEIKISNEIYNKLKIILLNQLNQLNQLIDNNNQRIIIENEESININNLLNNNNNNKINIENENKSIEIKNKGNQYFLKFDYKKSIEYYKNALSFKDLSNSLKSILYMNLSISEFQSSKQERDNFVSIFSDNQDYNILEKSKYYIIQSIIYNPNNFKSFYRFGIILSVLSNYEKAIQVFEASLLLLSLSSSLSSSLIKTTDELNKSILLINDQIKECKIKLEFINQCKNKDGSRNIEKEMNGLFNRCFQFNEILKIFKKNKLDNSNQSNNGMETLYILLESNTENSSVWYEIMCIEELFKNNSNLTLGLILKISMLPYPLPNDSIILQYYQKNQIDDDHDDDQDDEENINNKKYLINYKVVVSQEYLGSIYASGKFNQDIDYERAEYFFLKAIENDQKYVNKNLSNEFGLAYQCLSTIYIENRLDSSKNISNHSCDQLNLEINKKKALQICKLGKDRKVNSEYKNICKEMYNLLSNSN